MLHSVVGGWRFWRGEFKTTWQAGFLSTCVGCLGRGASDWMDRASSLSQRCLSRCPVNSSACCWMQSWIHFQMKANSVTVLTLKEITCLETKHGYLVLFFFLTKYMMAGNFSCAKSFSVYLSIFKANSWFYLWEPAHRCTSGYKAHLW